MASEVKQRISATKPALKKTTSEPNKKNVSDVSDDKKTALLSKEANQKKFGPMGIKKEDQLWSRAVLMTGVLVIVIVMKLKKTSEITWISQQEVVAKVKQPLICSSAYHEEITKFEGNLYLSLSLIFDFFVNIAFLYRLCNQTVWTVCDGWSLSGRPN